MATQQKAPIYVSQEVWDEVEDMSDVLRKMEEEGLKPEIDPESEATEEEYVCPSASPAIRRSVRAQSCRERSRIADGRIEQKRFLH